jgi:hypothetical protein
LAADVYSFLKVTVTGNKVTVTPMNAAGKTFDVQTYTFSGNGACLAFNSCPAAGGPPAGGPPPKDTTPPVISRFSVTDKRFALGPKPTAVSAAKRKKKVVRGTTFKFTLSEAATVRIALTQNLKGHRARRKKPCKPARRGQKRNCTRMVTLLTLVRAHGHKGSNSVAFSGRYRRKRLANGTYTATITATDPARNRSKPHRLTFRVV